MKIFTKSNGVWDKKVNFVDCNNTLVGYDLEQNCCETAGWFITDHRHTDTDCNLKQDCCKTAGWLIASHGHMDTNCGITIADGLDEYFFDRGFFEQVEDVYVDDGGMVRFRLVADGKPDLFLHIFNVHNGYYAHGFEVHHSGVVVRDSSL